MEQPRQFEVVLETAEEGGFVVSVPDLPGVWTQGRDARGSTGERAGGDQRIPGDPAGRGLADPEASSGARNDRGVSQRLPAVTAKQLVTVLERAGWRQVRVTGSHHHFIHPAKRRAIVVPMHPGDLKRPLVAGYSRTPRSADRSSCVCDAGASYLPRR